MKAEAHTKEQLLKVYIPNLEKEIRLLQDEIAKSPLMGSKLEKDLDKAKDKIKILTAEKRQLRKIIKLSQKHIDILAELNDLDELDGY